MASDIIKHLAYFVATPEMVESVSFGLSPGQYASQNRLFALNINLTSAGTNETGYTRFQVVFFKTYITMFGTKPNGTYDTFGSIS